jgi:hypothetical protein
MKIRLKDYLSEFKENCMTIFKEPFASLVREMGSPTKVAAVVGCTEATVIKWGAGKAKPSGDYQTRIIKLCIERGIEYDVKDDPKASDTEIQVKIAGIETRLSKLEENPIGIKESSLIDNSEIMELKKTVLDLESKLLILSKPMMTIDNDNNVAPVADITLNQFKRDIEALNATLDITGKRVNILLDFMHIIIEFALLKDDGRVAKLLQELENA